MKKITLLLMAFLALQMNAQDNCGAAVEVFDGDTTNTTITAGTGSAEMAPTGADSAWYFYTATADGVIYVNSCGGGADTDLSISDGTGACGSLTGTNNDDSCDLGTGDDWASELTIPVVTGNVYYIEWSNEWSNGPFDWTITYSPPPPPPTTIATINLADCTSSGTTTNAYDPGVEDVQWVELIVGGTCTPTILTLDTEGSALADTEIGVYDDNGDLIGVDDDGGTGALSLLNLDLAPGTYYIALGGFNVTYGANSWNVSSTEIEVNPITVNAFYPIPNDDCPGAIALIPNATATDYNNTFATDSGAAAGATCFTGTVRDLWYSFTTPATGVSTIVITGPASVYALYSDCATPVASGCSTDSPTLVADTSYLISITDDGTNRIAGAGTIAVSNTLSTTDFDNGLAFTYYPNPVNDNLAIKAQKDIENISVYNMLGQEVLNTTPNAFNANVNMSSLQSGAYFVKVTIANATETVRVIKN